MNKIDIVISYYNESEINWILNDIPNNFNVYFYQKLDESNLEPTMSLSYFLTTLQKNPKSKILKLPNEGRESDTYLHHIIKNYDNLADLTIFTQAEPHKHSPDFSKLLKNYEDYESFQCLTDRYSDEHEVPPKKVLEAEHIKNKHLKEYRCSGHLYNLKYLLAADYFFPYDMNLYLEVLKELGFPNEKFTSIDSLCHTLKKDANINIIENFLNKCEITPKFNQRKFPSIYFMCIGACFGVKKDRILQNSIESYKKIKDLNLKHWVYGYLCERSWSIVFGPAYDTKTLLRDLNIFPSDGEKWWQS